MQAMTTIAAPAFLTMQSSTDADPMGGGAYRRPTIKINCGAAARWPRMILTRR
jgi:hypothetical protein